jgi:hypothetical protein
VCVPPSLAHLYYRAVGPLCVPASLLTYVFALLSALPLRAVCAHGAVVCCVSLPLKHVVSAVSASVVCCVSLPDARVKGVANAAGGLSDMISDDQDMRGVVIRQLSKALEPTLRNVQVALSFVCLSLFVCLSEFLSACLPLSVFPHSHICNVGFVSSLLSPFLSLLAQVEFRGFKPELQSPATLHPVHNGERLTLYGLDLAGTAGTVVLTGRCSFVGGGRERERDRERARAYGQID